MPDWFKKKPSVFDEAQDRQLKALITNQQQIIKNQNALIANQNGLLKKSANHWAWIVNLDKRVKALKAESVQNRHRDAELAAKFQSLGSTLTSQDETPEAETP